MITKHGESDLKYKLIRYQKKGSQSKLRTVMPQRKERRKEETSSRFITNWKKLKSQ